MSLSHNFLAGTIINYQQSLFFDLMESGDVYLGFARTDPVWGFASMLKVRHSRTWATGVMGQANGGLPDADADVKFYDINSSRILLPGEVPAGSDQVYISYIDKNDDAGTFVNHTILSLASIGTLTLDYMNEEWIRIRGLNTDYLEEVITSFPVATYDYYLFNYDKHISSRTPMETITKVSIPTIRNPIRLMYSTVASPTGPTTAFGNNLVGDLVESINMFGERTITGMANNFVIDGAGYIPDNSLNSATFYLTTSDGIVIEGDMRFVEQIRNDDEISLVFSYPLVGEAVQNSGRIRITTTANADKLAVFNERFSDGRFVSDNNPPPLFLNYLKIAMFHTSIFDVLGMVRIEAADVDFARRVDNQDTFRLLFGDANDPVNFPGVPELITSPGNPAAGATITITIDDDPATSVDFAITNDTSIARRYFFDLVRVQKTLDSTTPTSAVYRQLFVCYLPKDSSGGDLGLSATDFVHTDLFDETLHQYDLGTILYLVNKEPVFREHLAQDEEFTLLI